MKRDLDRIRLQVEELADLPCSQVGAEAKCNELAIAFGELRDSRPKLESLEDLICVILGCRVREPRRPTGSRRSAASAMQRRAIPISQAPASPRLGSKLSR